MARIRSIKPEFWTSEQILECSRNARLLFIGLWNFCDDAGRHPFSAKQAKAEVFPGDDLSVGVVQGMLDELSEKGLIARYTSDGKEFFEVTGWKHQRIDKPQSPKYPEPFEYHSKNVRRTLPPDRIGKDRIGEDKIERRAKALAPDWQPSPENQSKNLSGYPASVLNEELEKFRDHFTANGKPMKDWDAAFRNWMRRRGEFQRGPPRQQQTYADQVAKVAEQIEREIDERDGKRPSEIRTPSGSSHSYGEA